MSTLNQVAGAIAIFSQYLDADTEFFEADHDVIYGPCSNTLKGITPEDKKKLNELGWHEDSEYDCWVSYC